MTELFDGLGAGTLLRDLHVTLDVLNKINSLGAEAEVASFIEQVSDFIDITQKIDHLATKERRDPSIHLKIRSTSALLHLRAVLDSTAAVIQECTPYVRPLRSSLETFIYERDATGYLGPENRLENQPWYEETFLALRLLIELLRALFTAIELLQFHDTTDEDPQSLKERSSTATTLHYRVGLVEQQLHSNALHDISEVWKYRSYLCTPLTVPVDSTGCSSCQSYYTTDSSNTKPTLRYSETSQDLLHW